VSGDGTADVTGDGALAEFGVGEVTGDVVPAQPAASTTTNPRDTATNRHFFIFFLLSFENPFYFLFIICNEQKVKMSGLGVFNV
jgi:hypothetical protein